MRALEFECAEAGGRLGMQYSFVFFLRNIVHILSVKWIMDALKAEEKKKKQARRAVFLNTRNNRRRTDISHSASIFLVCSSPPPHTRLLSYRADVHLVHRGKDSSKLNYCHFYSSWNGLCSLKGSRPLGSTGALGVVSNDTSPFGGEALLWRSVACAPSKLKHRRASVLHGER